MANFIRHYRTLTAGQALPAPSADLVGTLAMQANEADRKLWFCVGTAGNEVWVLVANDVWQPYSESLGITAIADTGLSYTPGQGVQIIDMGPPPGNPGDARFDDWNQYLIADIDAAAAYALPTSDTARILDTSASFRVDPYVAQEGVAKLVEVADLTSIGTVNWDIDKLIYEGNIDSNIENYNQRFEIWGDLAGVPDPANVLVAVAGIDHSGMAGGTGNATFDLNLTTPLSVTSLDKLWIVCLRLNAPADFRAASLWNWGDRPADQSDTGTYIKTPVTNAAVRVTADDGVTWGAAANDPGLRVRVNMVRTSANQPPSSVYGVTLEAIDDTTVGGVILQGGVLMDASGAPFGETWNNNDLIYADVVGGGALTNVPPADPLDHIVMGSVLDNSAANGALYVSAATTGTRGIFMPISVYDPQGEYKDVFNLNNIDRGTLEGDRVTIDDTAFDVLVGTDAQALFDYIDDLFVEQEPESFRLLWADGIANNDPTAGYVSGDAANLNAVARLNVSTTSSVGRNLRPYLANMTIGDTLILSNDIPGGDIFQYTIAGVITDQTTYFEIPVTALSGSFANPAQDDPVILKWIPAGGSGAGDPAILRSPTTNAENTVTVQADANIGLTFNPNSATQTGAAILVNDDLGVKVADTLFDGTMDGYIIDGGTY